MTAIDRVRAAAKFHGYRPPESGDRWRMPCPGHGGKDPNLAVTQGERGVLLTCHSHGCTAESIATALGLTPSDLFDAPPPNSAEDARPLAWRTVATYPYLDEEGRELFQVVRQEAGESVPGRKAPKTFLQRTRAADGSWAYTLAGVRRVLYQLPRVLEAVAEERLILIVEGEKAAHAADALGFVATCNAGGALRWLVDGRDAHGYASALTGAHVVLLPDQDAPGWKHVQQVGAALAGLAASVRVLELPSLPPKGDLHDWREAGGTAEQLHALLDQAAPFDTWAREIGTRLAAVEGEGLGESMPDDDALPRPKALVDVDPTVRIDWLVDDLLVAADIGWIGGADGTFKSTVALHIGCAVAGGRQVFGRFPAREGPVLLVSGEDPEAVLRNRAEAICRGQGWPTREILSRVHVLALAGVDLRDRAWQAHLLGITSDLRPALILLDPFFELVSGDENSNSDAKSVVRTLRALTLPSQATVLVVHHFRKAAEGTPKVDMFRGATAPLKASRQTYAIEKGPDDAILVECVKFSRAQLAGSIRSKFALRPTIVTDESNEALWRSARLDFVSAHQARFDAAENFVLRALGEGLRFSTTELKDQAKGTGVSGADIARSLRSLEMRNLIDFEPGARGAKLWGLTQTTLPNGPSDPPNATLPSDLGKVGKVGNDLAGQGGGLPGKVSFASSTLPAPFRGQAGKVGEVIAGQGGGFV